MLDIRVNPLDKIEVSDYVQEKLAATVAFALKDQYRMRSFFAKMAYLLSWGRGEDGQSPIMLSIHPDHTPHSYIFSITTFRYDDEKHAIVSNTPFVVLMYYRAEDDRWETHS